MSNKKSTKRALLLSVVSMLICVVMLAGTTFAWFTDSVSSGKNQILAGNLDIDLEYSKTMAEGSWKTVKDATDLFSTTLWEPGHTEVVYLKVRNLGTLNLKYTFSMNIFEETPGINVADQSFKLSDYIKFGIVEADEAYTADDAGRKAARADVAADAQVINSGYTAASTLAPKTDAKTVAFVVYMPEEVGNVANYKTGTTAPSIDLGVKVEATQVEAEEDSFGNTYDAFADAAQVSDVASLNNAIANGGEIFLTDDINLTNINLSDATNDVTINANGNTITVDDAQGLALNAPKNVTISNANIVVTEDGTGSKWAAGIKVDNADYENSTLKLTNSTITMANNDWAYGINLRGNVSNMNIVLENCEITGAIALNVWGDKNTITATNCTFVSNYNVTDAFGAAIVKFNDNGADIAQNNDVTFTDCTFDYTGTINGSEKVYAVINMDDSNTFTFNGTTTYNNDAIVTGVTAE